jgi:hypothetical protein
MWVEMRKNWTSACALLVGAEMGHSVAVPQTQHRRPCDPEISLLREAK